MVQIHNEALQETISAGRILEKIESDTKGPTIVYFSGIHGNETAGVFALREVISQIRGQSINGTIYAILGNLKALQSKQRFIEQDLNRLWTVENLEALQNKKNRTLEEQEQLELFTILKDILNKNNGPFYFIDLHTTSGKTPPFITINDAIINRKFSKQFPVPIVLGIEEYLNGPLLSYINSLGYMALGFESGQHDDINAVSNSVAFIYLSLVFANIMEKQNIPNFDECYNRLKKESNKMFGVFDIIYLHKIHPQESFKMLNGFENFQFVKRKTPLAKSNSKTIKSKYSAQIFMPLYQKQGDEGFFIIRKIKPFILKLSVVLRRFKADGLLILLPGISWYDSKKQSLSVNLKTARFMAKSIFHLLGYRNKQIGNTHLILFNRERTAKSEMYKNETWYKYGKA